MQVVKPTHCVHHKYLAYSCMPTGDKTDEYLEHLLLEVAVRSGQFFAGLVGGTHPSIHEIGELLGESLVLFGDCCS